MIRPLPNYLVIEPIEDDNKTSSGLYLPDSSKDKPSKGKVIASSDIFMFDGDTVSGGPNLTSSYFPIEGKTVIFKKWTNQEVEDKGKKYILVKFDELLGIIE